MKITTFVSIGMIGLLGLSSCGNSTTQLTSIDEKPLTKVPNTNIPYNPERYIAYKASSPINIDGDISGKEWENAKWTNTFVDIEGEIKPKPLFPTRAKMLWDENYFYFAFEITEPDIWATLTERDAVIFNDNDIEIFMDPDGDTHHYYEFELNSFNNMWDLMLTKPYRESGNQVLDAWTIRGIKTAVKIYGTINNPKDKDDKWTVEVAMPWTDIEEAAHHNGIPKDNEQWRVNFSRVNWQMDKSSGKYVKAKDPKTGKQFPEYNWVWSPQGVIQMHQPETWGFVQFSEKTVGNGTSEFITDKNDAIKWALRQLYYRQNAYKTEYGHFASTNSALKVSDIKVDGVQFAPEISTFNGRWEAKQKGLDGKSVFIQWDGRVWYE